MRGAAISLLFAATAASAETVDITRSCFPEFCIESRDAFIAIARNPEKGDFRLRVFRSESTIYIQKGGQPAIRSCGPLCATEDRDGESRAFNVATHRLIGRAIGPLVPCGAGAPFYVSLFVYVPGVDLTRYEIVRHCN